jgi:hypothetical protein
LHKAHKDQANNAHSLAGIQKDKLVVDFSETSRESMIQSADRI